MCVSLSCSIGHFATQVEQHKMHMLINMEQPLLLMLRAMQDMHALDGALGLYED